LIADAIRAGKLRRVGRSVSGLPPNAVLPDDNRFQDV
jgi:hypothetical protein